MLGFHESIVEEVAQQDGLVVMAAGLGMHKVRANPPQHVTIRLVWLHRCFSRSLLLLVIMDRCK